MTIIKNYIRIINEEISKFDFLNNDKYLKDEKNNYLIANEDFQKQFICDSLINKKNIKLNVADAHIGGDWENYEEATKLTIEYYVDVIYIYDINHEPIKFIIDFSSNNIGINIDTKVDNGSYDVQSTSDAHYNSIDWSSIDVFLRTTDGNEIDFIAFKKAPITIQNLFIREYIENFIDKKTIPTDNLKKDNIRNITYC